MPEDLAGQHPHGSAREPPALQPWGVAQVRRRGLDLVTDALELVGELAQPVAGLAFVRGARLLGVDAEGGGIGDGIDRVGVAVRGRGAQGREQGHRGHEAAARAVALGDALGLGATEGRHDHGQGADATATGRERVVRAHAVAEGGRRGGPAAAAAAEEPRRRDQVEPELHRRLHARERRGRGMFVKGGRAHRQHRCLDARPQPEVGHADRGQVEDEIPLAGHRLGRDEAGLAGVARLALAHDQPLLRDRPPRQRSLLGQPDAQEGDRLAEDAVRIREEERGVGGVGPAGGAEEGCDQGQSPWPGPDANAPGGKSTGCAWPDRFE